MKSGFVYVFTNEAMPGLVKIGHTEDVAKRLERLSNHTGVPGAFECFFAAWVEDCRYVEKKLHDGLDQIRYRKNREFFEIAPERVKALLELTEHKPFEPEPPTGHDDVEFASTRLPRLNLHAAGLNDGDELRFTRDELVRVIARKSNLVEMNGDEITLAQATQNAFRQSGHKWSVGAAAEYWRFGDDLLSELIRTNDPKKAGRGFALEQVFPVIARVITSINRTTGSYASHKQIAEELVRDREAIGIISTTEMLTRFASRDQIASNMVAWWSQQVTVGENQHATKFLRRRGTGPYEYWDQEIGPAPE